MITRPRRLRITPAIRNLVCETSICKTDFIYPLFVIEGENIRQPIDSMPGVFRYSIDLLEAEIKEITSLGITAILLFGIPEKKDAVGSEAYNPNGVVQNAIRKIKEIAPELIVIADICLCEYTDHGHCGVLDTNGYVNNDKTLELLAKAALSCAVAGADIVAPSDMMDGRVAAIREKLDNNGYENVSILSYSAKYASNYYGPFRNAAGSAPSFGDRKSYQMDYRNSDEALREVELDLEEGADALIVKPAVMGLDILRRVKDNFNVPIAAYMVSGEYSMIKNAVMNGLLNPDAMFEAHIALKRAGAKMIISYAAKEICERL